MALIVLQTQGYEMLEWGENLQSLKELRPLRGPSCVLDLTRALQTALSPMLPAVFCPKWAHISLTVPTDRQVKLGEVSPDNSATLLPSKENEGFPKARRAGLQNKSVQGYRHRGGSPIVGLLNHSLVTDNGENQLLIWAHKSIMGSGLNNLLSTKSI